MNKIIGRIVGLLVIVLIPLGIGFQQVAADFGDGSPGYHAFSLLSLAAIAVGVVVPLDVMRAILLKQKTLIGVFD